MMRIKLEFEVSKLELPLEYRRSFISFIKKSLSQSRDGIYLEKYYRDTNQKDFTWCMIFSNPHFTKEKIILENNTIKVIVSTEDVNKTGYILYMAFIAQKFKRFPLENDNFIVLKDIQQVTQQIITQDKCIFKTITGAPFALREHSKESNLDKYYSVANEDFEEVLTASLKRQALKEGFDSTMVDLIKARPINCRKAVIKHYGVLIDANIGLIEIEGSSIILQYFYQSGMGSRKSEGFGMVELIGQNI
jgi:CRISPR-associated endoribonuclease Cas6